jgi:FkbM family methyltransferase
MVKDRIKATPLYPGLKAMRRLVRRLTGRRHPLQDIRPAPRADLIRLGTAYGGWWIRDDPSLQGTVVLSAGLGEDASFDIDIARRYGATILMVDPTPRAVAHFQAIGERIGRAAEAGYRPGGNQPVAAYDLTGIAPDRLILDPRALWREDGTVRFHPPRDPRNVSHSIRQRDRTAGPALDVPCCCVPTLLADHALDPARIGLVKLDIEGAEIEVVIAMLEAGLRPPQICVEYDDLLEGRRKAHDRVDRAHAALGGAGYACVHGDGGSGYLYLRA